MVNDAYRVSVEIPKAAAAHGIDDTAESKQAPSSSSSAAKAGLEVPAVVCSTVVQPPAIGSDAHDHSATCASNPSAPCGNYNHAANFVQAPAAATAASLGDAGAAAAAQPDATASQVPGTGQRSSLDGAKMAAAVAVKIEQDKADDETEAAAAATGEVDGDQDEGDADDDMCAEPETESSPAPVLHICMVDGCGADLSEMKAYFRRSKVCPAHQASPVVLLEGEECRFCQQCTRCHPLAEFDGTKRSCRSQLLHHNKSRKHRRRCTPGSFYSSKRPRNGAVAKKKAAAAQKSPAAAAAKAARQAAKTAAAAGAAQAAAAAAGQSTVPTPTAAAPGFKVATDVWGALAASSTLYGSSAVAVAAAQPQMLSPLAMASSRSGMPRSASRNSSSKSLAAMLIQQQQQQDTGLPGSSMQHLGMPGFQGQMLSYGEGMGNSTQLPELQPGMSVPLPGAGPDKLSGLQPGMSVPLPGCAYSRLSGLQPVMSAPISGGGPDRYLGAQPGMLSGQIAERSGLQHQGLLDNSKSYASMHPQYQQYLQHVTSDHAAAGGPMFAAPQRLPGSHPNLHSMAAAGAHNHPMQGIADVSYPDQIRSGQISLDQDPRFWDLSRTGGAVKSCFGAGVPGQLTKQTADTVGNSVVKFEDDLGTASSCCSSRGSPNMGSTTTTTAVNATHYIAGGRIITTQQQQQQHMAWQQQQHRQQLSWQQQQAEMSWQQQAQQQQQQQVQANWVQEQQQGSQQVAWRIIHQQQQQQQQLCTVNSCPAPTTATASAAVAAPGTFFNGSSNSSALGRSYSDWQGTLLPQHHLQQQQAQQQGLTALQQQLLQSAQLQHMSVPDAVSSYDSCYDTWKAQATTAAAAAATAGIPTGSAAATARAASAAYHAQRQQQIKASLQQQQHTEYMQHMQMQQQFIQMHQQASPDMSAGSSCAAPAIRPQDDSPPAAAVASTATATATATFVAATPTNHHMQLNYDSAGVMHQNPYSNDWHTAQHAARNQQQHQGFGPSVGYDLSSQVLGSGTAAAALVNPRMASVAPSSAVPAAPPARQLSDIPAMAALVAGLIDSDIEDSWLLDACRSPGKGGCDGLIDHLTDLF